jgi:hypothetical protein
LEKKRAISLQFHTIISRIIRQKTVALTINLPFITFSVMKHLNAAFNLREDINKKVYLTTIFDWKICDSEPTIEKKSATPCHTRNTALLENVQTIQSASLKK